MRFAVVLLLLALAARSAPVPQQGLAGVLCRTVPGHRHAAQNTGRGRVAQGEKPPTTVGRRPEHQPQDAGPQEADDDPEPGLRGCHTLIDEKSKPHDQNLNGRCIRRSASPAQAASLCDPQRFWATW